MTRERFVYYMTQRPPMPGAMPKEGLEGTLENYDSSKSYIKEIGLGAYAKLTYNRKLTGKEISDYELIPRDVEIELTYGEVRLLAMLLEEQAANYDDKAHDLYKIYKKLRETLEVN